MKTILLTLALAGFTMASGYAQNSKNCTCKKPAHHKTHQKVAVGLKTTTPPLYTNRTHNVKGPEAPDTYHGMDIWQNDNATPVASMAVAYNSESSYTGNYPKPTLQYTKVDPREDNNKSPNVSGLCLYDCRTK